MINAERVQKYSETYNKYKTTILLNKIFKKLKKLSEGSKIADTLKEDFQI